MNVTLIIVIGMLTLSILAPFISLYAVSLVRKGDHEKHIFIQKILFWSCVAGVVILEVQIRVSGGSGSLVSNSEHTGAVFFKSILVAHIIGAVLTYIVWGVTVFTSSKRWEVRKTLPGPFSITHKRLGYFTIVGLFYTAITASIVCMLAFFL
ncbi:DUF420 domain-containing protein [Roseimaritima sediminicola]|uniref:DUF420 domain-containing protein n=1 Tax=Roseimaritima sediminicola TaxID=2662066 RepID=UPI00129845B5|nr:DUF420 domain-containing protein [Roseimaritima sediminicola]